MSFFSRYTLTCPVAALPHKIRFRNGTLTFEIARDCSIELPAWVFRARKLAARPMPVINPRRPLCPVPSISPAQLAVETQLAAQNSTFTIASCFYGRRHLEMMLRDGITLPEESTHARLMDVLVALGHAKKWNATRRDMA